jgi:tetratricopeptide (TPR) repeat protein
MALDHHHPGAERLAEYADGVLVSAERTEMERHLADCAECREVVAEAMSALQDDRVALSAPRVRSFRARPWVIGVASGLAAAAAVVVAVRVFATRNAEPELQELIAAVGHETTRPVEGRLSAAFAYAPPPPVTRGPADRRVAPDVLIAAMTIEKTAKARPSATGDAAIGLAKLALGDPDEAVKALSAATIADGRRAPFYSDLSAAYIARGALTADRADFSRAADAASTALRIDPHAREALFNRALALSRLGRSADSREAWLTFLSQETDPNWIAEAHHLLEGVR